MTRYLLCVVLYKVGWQVVLTQFVLYIPLPVGDGAVADAKPDTQDKPRCCGDEYACKMHLPCSPGYPAKKVEQHNGEMQNRKEYVGKLQHLPLS